MPQTSEPKVTVIIPTHQRADVLARAIDSVLSQTFMDWELVVVVDGPDAEAEAVLAGYADPRINSIVLAENRGPSAARNAGVTRATAPWIAFLDDDDEWLPVKLAAQLKHAERPGQRPQIVATRFHARVGSGEYIWPRRLPRPDMHISDYLYTREGFFRGENCVKTSTLLVARELLMARPFAAEMRNHEDWHWLLRAAGEGQARIDMLAAPLAIVHELGGRPNLSKSGTWHYSLGWARAHRDLLTDNAFASFLLIELGSQASRQQAWGSFVPLLTEAFRCGRPTVVSVFYYFAVWLLPRGLQRLLRARLPGEKKAPRISGAP